MNVELLNEHGDVITVLNGVQHPTQNFELYWKHQFGATGFREASRVNENATLVTAVRKRRNDLLAASDWTVLPHSPLSPADVEAWVQYRTELRDMVTQAVENDYRQAVWPVDPNGRR